MVNRGWDGSNYLIFMEIRPYDKWGRRIGAKSRIQTNMNLQERIETPQYTIRYGK
jgi:hypothetical protein